MRELIITGKVTTPPKKEENQLKFKILNTEDDKEKLFNVVWYFPKKTNLQFGDNVIVWGQYSDNLTITNEKNEFHPEDPHFNFRYDMQIERTIFVITVAREDEDTKEKIKRYIKKNRLKKE